MTHAMACYHSDIIAAGVSLAGAQFNSLNDCQAKHPVSMLQIHGTADETILYPGGYLRGVPYPGAVTTVADWITLNGCTEGSLTVSGPPFKISKALPGLETTPFSAQCPPGVDVSHWLIHQGDHIPPLESDFAERIITYLLAHPKP